MAIAASIALVVAALPTGSLSPMFRASAMGGASIGANVATGLATNSPVTNATDRPSLVGSAASTNPITEYPIPNSASNLQDIAAGPDGGLWFTGAAAAATPHKIGRITTGGAVSAFALPITSCQPGSISAGPDGNLWFIEQSGGFCAKVGRITTTGTITEFALPSASSIPADITGGQDGNLWFTEPGANKIGRITTSGVVTEFAISANSGPTGITAGPDGNLWFTENAANKIGRITTAGAITEFPVTTVGSAPTNIAAGPDGNLWFTEGLASKIGRITPAGVVTEFPLSASASAAGDIARGSDGNLWFTEAKIGATSAPNIGRMTTSGVVTDFPIPSGGTSLPTAIAAGPDGNLWFSDSEGNDIGRITTAGTITHFPVPGFNQQQIPNGIVAGPDGNVWYPEAAEIARLTPGGIFTEFPIPTLVSVPGGIAAGADGNLWFTEIRVGKIGRITTAGVASEFSIPTTNSHPWGIAAGPDGNLWFIDSVVGNPGTANVGRITTSGVITEFQAIASSAFSIAAGPDANLWFTEQGANKIGRITTAGTITEFPIPTAFAYPSSITAGPDGNLWFTELGIDKIARITTAGTITEFPVPTASAYLTSITAGPEGNLWFTEGGGANKVARITTAGAITEFPIPTFYSSPFSIAPGPDGNLWFTEQAADQIGRFMLNTGLGAPSGVYAMAGDGEATVTWMPPSDTGPPLSGYTVVASPGGALTTVSATVPSATVTGLTNGTPYTFTVAATNAVGTGPASATTAAVTPTAVAQASLVAVLPAMSNNAYGGYLTTAYLQNTGSSPAHIRVQYFNTAGQGAGFGNSVAGLAPGATWTLRTDNGNSLAAAQPGFADVYSDQPVAVFVNEFAPGGSDATSYTSISNPAGTGSTLFAPAIANGAYGGYTTGIGLVNLASSAVTITVTYRDGAGTVVQTQTLPGVPAGAYQGLYSGTAGLPAAFAGTATISSSGGSLAAVVNETGPGGQFSSYDAVPVGSTTLFAPAALSNAFGGYNTGMGIQNTTGTAGTVTVTYYDNTGTPTAHNFAIGANGYVGIYQGTDIAAGAYTAKITSTVAVAAIVNEVAPSANPAVQQSTAYNTFAAGSSSLHLPLVESAGADGWSTGEGIMNTGTAATTVTVTYYDTATGLQVGTPDTLTLQPNAFWGLYQPAGGLPSGDRASATVTTTAGGQVAVICNESNATSFMSYTAQ